MNKEKFVEKTIAKWTRLLNLDDWDIRYKIEKVEATGDGYGNFANNAINSKYKTSRINFFPVMFKQSKSDWESIILHELVHLLIAELYHKGMERCINEEEIETVLEQTVEKLTRLFIGK